MSSPHKFPTQFSKALMTALALVLNETSPLAAAPPPERESRGLEKVGDFFFKLARRLERRGGEDDDDEDSDRGSSSPRMNSHPKSGASTGLSLPPGYQRGDENRSGSVKREAPQAARPAPAPRVSREEPFTPPTFQPNPQPYRLYPETSPSSTPKPDMPPQGSAAPLEKEPAQKRIAPAEVSTPLDPPARSSQKEDRTEPPAVSQPVTSSKAPIPFATPVPGSRGFVYPPGAKHEPGNMLDVREFSSGQKVRDPRSGQMFLVPPR